MSAEILSTPPSSGHYSEKHFGGHFNFKLWVKFTDNNSEDWAGCFSKPYDSGLNKVLVDDTNSTALVIAGGLGYLIDISNKKVIQILDEQPMIESAIKTVNPNYFVAGTFYGFYVLDKEGFKQEIRPDFIIDGIYLKGQQDNKAIGELATAYNQYKKNVGFEFDLTTFQLALKENPGIIGELWKKITNR